MTHRFSTLALARAARLLVTALVSAAAAPTVALALVPEPTYQQALTVIAQYGRDASLVVPCATMAGLGDSNPKIVNQWDEVSVRQALDKFAQQRGPRRSRSPRFTRRSRTTTGRISRSAIFANSHAPAGTARSSSGCMS